MNPSAIEDLYEMSPLQQGILFHSLSAADPEMYLAQRSYEIRGRLDVQAIEQAWRDVVRRHPALRTTFHWETLDKPLQAVRGDVPLGLIRHDWRDYDLAEGQAAMQRCLTEDRQQGFDLARPPLMRLRLIQYGEEHYQFVWTHHMILLDGWSVPLVTRDLFARYRALTGGEPVTLPAAQPYGSYIEWLQGQDMTAAELFWRAHLRGFSSPTTFSGSGEPARLDGPADTVGQQMHLSGAVSTGLRALAAQSRVTLNTVVQAAWALLLSRYAGTDDVVFGVTSSGRPAELPGVESTVGLFINTLPFRVLVPHEREVGEYLREVQARQLEVRRYEYTPLTAVRNYSQLARRARLFESVVVFENYPVMAADQSVDGLKISSDFSFEKTSEPLTLIAAANPDLMLRLVYHRDRFSDAVIADIMEQLRTVLEEMQADQSRRIGEIEVLPRGQRERVLRVWNETNRSYPCGLTLHGLVEAQAERTPDAVAVVAEEGQLTYKELDSRAGSLAAVLCSHRVTADTRVGICADRSLEMVIGILAVLKAGAAYVPLDPVYPEERLAFMVRDAGVSVVLAADHLRDRLPAQPATVLSLSLAEARRDCLPGAAERAESASAAATEDNLAYVMYTSGSTGQPKGVMITHSAVCNRLLWMQETYRLAKHDRVLQKTPFSFDVSVWEFFWPLTVGATLVMARPDGHRDSAYLAQVIAEHGVTVAHFVPSMLRIFAEEAEVEGCTSLRNIICSGEALDASLRDQLLARLDVGLHNLYGPTEAAIDVTFWDCRQPAPGPGVPIGRPVANTEIFILDAHMRPVPPGVAGELHIGGKQLARGYLGRPGMTARSFVANPFGAPGSRLYKSGDLARQTEDGTIQFLGRIDHQVKLRGVRIEPGETEATLTLHPQVREAAVVAREVVPGTTALVAYVVPAGGVPSAEELRVHLTARLPPQLVPGYVVVLDALPLTSNGKLDREALPLPVRGSQADSGALGAPRTVLEATVAAAFAHVLGLEQVDAEMSFFDLGGDSFSAIRAARDIPGASVAALFRYPTVRSLAAALGQEKPDTAQRLLRLTPQRPAATRTLVCVPYGGGSAIAFYPLARAMPEDFAVYGVLPPGHDLGQDEPLESIEATARACAEQIAREITGPVAVYGHCIGVALAVELAMRLEQAGHAVDRVFLGGSYPFPRKRILGVDIANVIPMKRRANDERVMRYLQSLGGFEEVIDGAELKFVMRAFRHDGADARRFFTAHHQNPGAERLRAPITFVAGTADPETPRYQQRHTDWREYSDSVDLSVVPGGGHYFLKHNAGKLAEIIESGLRQAESNSNDSVTRPTRNRM